MYVSALPLTVEESWTLRESYYMLTVWEQQQLVTVNLISLLRTLLTDNKMYCTHCRDTSNVKKREHVNASVTLHICGFLPYLLSCWVANIIAVNVKETAGLLSQRVNFPLLTRHKWHVQAVGQPTNLVKELNSAYIRIEFKSTNNCLLSPLRQ